MALADACWHRLAPLSFGKTPRKDQIQCPYHRYPLPFERYEPRRPKFLTNRFKGNCNGPAAWTVADKTVAPMPKSRYVINKIVSGST